MVLNGNKERILQKIEELKSQLECDVKFTADERRQMPMIGGNREKFIKATFEIVERDDGFLPKRFELEKMKENFNDYIELKEILLEFNNLKAPIYDKYIHAGTAAYHSALMIKKFLDSINAPEYESWRQKLHSFFPNGKKLIKPAYTKPA
ncbi:MAG: hypothetical protein HY738_13770 [Bacteroidia bacterium]|nr:hypothetical protein [Bacteroidia bacterium]